MDEGGGMELQPPTHPIIDMENQNERTWSTWEELLLACAVKRHGYKDWESVSMEIQTRTSLPQILTTAQHCKLKYHDLKRRFATAVDGEQEGDKVDDVPWLEELKKIRVAELKQEVQRYDVSILTLESKVKRLEEEREREHGLGEENGNIREKPDLEEERSENDKRSDDKGRETMPVKVENRKLITGDDSDRENRSVNGSNSTGFDRKPIEKEEILKSEPEPIQTGGDEPKPVLSGSNLKPGGEDDSVTQLSSDVQSSASLGSKRKRKVRKRRDVSGDGVKQVPEKSEPLIHLLDLIRTSHHGSLFEHRLESQQTEEYKNMVRQHMDLGVIETRLDQGYYKCRNLLFYRDLLLLFNNAIVFFPKSSQESLVAHELRTLLSAEMKKEIQKSDSTQKTASVPSRQPKPELEKSDSLPARQRSSAPIVGCRMRSSISSKSSLSSSFAKNVDQEGGRDDNDDNSRKPAAETKRIVVEQQSLLNIKPDSKPKTGTRSTRRGSSKLLISSTSGAIPNKKQTTILPGSKPASNDKVETLKTDKKRAESFALEKKKGAADFLKRIKKNSPQEPLKKSSSKGGNSSSGGGGEQKKKKTNGGKKDKGQDRITGTSNEKKQAKDHEGSPSKRSVGRPPKKTVEVSTVTGRRKRESDGNGAAEMKRPTKRSRR